MTATRADYADLVSSGDPILTDGATGTRLRLETDLLLDAHVDVAGLGVDGRQAALTAVAGEYAAIAHGVGLPIQLDAMTYWASPDYLRNADRESELEAMNRACIDAVLPVASWSRAYVAGVVGPRADAYRPALAMAFEEALDYHGPQVEALASASPDLLLASTMSTLGESVGLALAMSYTSTPFVVGFVLTAAGTLPDGTSLDEAMATIDASVERPPEHYLLSCTHPSIAHAGLRQLRWGSRVPDSRLIGIKANGSSEDLDVLDGSDQVHSDAPTAWARAMMQLRSDFGLRMLGGCCGTDGRHILALALELADGAS